MADAKVQAERVFDRNQKREAEINAALQEEAARHAAALKNMQRLKALRLAQEERAQEKNAAEEKAEKPPARRAKTGTKTGTKTGAKTSAKIAAKIAAKLADETH